MDKKINQASGEDKSPFKHNSPGKPRQPDDIPKNPIFGEYHRAGATPTKVPALPVNRRSINS
jgi:hypothetical protein